MAADMGVRFLGAIELDPRLGKACDSGGSFISEFPDSNVAKTYKRLVESKLYIVQQIVFIREILSLQTSHAPQEKNFLSCVIANSVYYGSHTLPTVFIGYW